MQPSSVDPLEQVREAALQHLSWMLLGVFTPAYLTLFVINLQDLLDEPLRLPIYALIPAVGVLIRPRTSRSLHRRGDLAVWSLGFVTMLTLVKTGVRQPWAPIAIVTLFALAVLFGGSRAFVQWALAVSIVGVAGVVLRTTGVVEPMHIGETTLFNDVGALVIGLSASVFVGLLVRSTLRIYREAHAEQHKAHDLLLAAEREAQSLQRQEVVATMARGMAHDLANLLQVVNASVELMRDSTDDNDRRELAAGASAIATRATRSLRALLTVGKGTSVAEDTTELCSMFERVESLLAPMMGARVQVTMHCRAVGHVPMSETVLEQVLLNLAFNARDAMPQGGTLSIEAHREDESGPMVVMTVKDTGHGIPADVMPRIFDPYVTTKAMGDGTGLGLAMVQRAVQDAGGTIAVDSIVGTGTTFTVQLPLS